MILATHPLPRVPAMSVEAFRKDWLEPGRPVVIEGALEAWPARTLFSFGWFRERWGPQDMRLNKSIPGARTMRLDAYLDAIDSGTAGPLYLDATPVSWLPGLTDALRPLPWVPADRTVQTLLWIGPGHTVLPFHKDNQTALDGNHNLFAQLVGSKRFLLVSPAHEDCMYPLPLVPHEYAKSGVDLGRLGDFPRFLEATVHEAVLGPGDLLFNPAHWWHHVEALEPSISVSTWWRASRLIEMLRALRGAIQAGPHVAEQWLARWQGTVTRADIDELGGADRLRALWAPLSPRVRDLCDALLDDEVRAWVAA